MARNHMQTALRWTQGLLFVGAAVLLGYGGFVGVGALLSQERESSTQEHLLESAAAPDRFIVRAERAHYSSSPQSGPGGLSYENSSVI